MKYTVPLFAFLLLASVAFAQELTISRVSDHTLEVQLGSAGAKTEPSPMLADFPREEKWRGPVEKAPSSLVVGDLLVEIERSPLALTVKSKEGKILQRLSWRNEGSMVFKTDAPVFGLGQGGGGLDRRGSIQPLSDGYVSGNTTSRVNSPVLIGADGWALFFPNLPDKQEKHSPGIGGLPGKCNGGMQGTFDLRDGQGVFSWPNTSDPQRFFVICSDQPPQILAELRRLTGGAVMPPRWALGYMQSHRTLEGLDAIVQVAKTFREKKLPCDALIYLSQVYCDSGWGNGVAPFSWNTNNFPDPAGDLSILHGLHFKVVLHASRYPSTLQGESVTQETDDKSHIAYYWKQHLPVHNTGVDAWWADDGEDLNTAGRLARHRMYYEGPLQVCPNERPWSLHRTMVPGAQRFGGWLWSGDPLTTWAALAAHVPSALSSGLSLTPFWGSDIGGFYCKNEHSAELFARWFQFGAFSPSFRSHGRNWHLRLPWGLNTGQAGIYEEGYVPKGDALRNAEIEPICRKYLDLRYQLLPYNYTLAREACDTGMPMMRALWLHYPEDSAAVACESEFLWGRDFLVAPVIAKGATERSLYLPRGLWYDWWTGEQQQGGREITRAIDLATMPLYVRAGAIIPFDPVRQFTGEIVSEPTEIRIFPGADGHFTLYDDDGHSLDYLKNEGSRIKFTWSDMDKTLAIEPVNDAASRINRKFNLRIMPDEKLIPVEYGGKKITSSIAYN